MEQRDRIEQNGKTRVKYKESRTLNMGESISKARLAHEENRI